VRHLLIFFEMTTRNFKENQKPLLISVALLSSSDRSFAESPVTAGGGLN
jgi:hypothetical protein